MSDLDFVHLGNVVRMDRERRGWTQAALADRAGISTRVVSSVENGTGSDSGKATRGMRLISVALNWTPRALTDVLAGGTPTYLGASVPDYVPRAVEDQRLRDLRDDEILSYLARRAAENNPDSPHYRPDQE